jgi:hypothetical protein
MERLMSDDVRSDLSELAALHLRDACKLVGSSEWKMRKEIERGEYESYLDGNRRKVTLRSIKARQERLIKAQTPSPTIPPPPQRSKQEATAKIYLRGTPQPPNAPRRGRPRKPEPAATATPALAWAGIEEDVAE